jgi:hypothetical protein
LFTILGAIFVRMIPSGEMSFSPVRWFTLGHFRRPLLLLTIGDVVLQEIRPFV